LIKDPELIEVDHASVILPACPQALRSLNEFPISYTTMETKRAMESSQRSGIAKRIREGRNDAFITLQRYVPLRHSGESPDECGIECGMTNRKASHRVEHRCRNNKNANILLYNLQQFRTRSKHRRGDKFTVCINKIHNYFLYIS
jgi:hypothetical protein